MKSLKYILEHSNTRITPKENELKFYEITDKTELKDIIK